MLHTLHCHENLLQFYSGPYVLLTQHSLSLSLSLTTHKFTHTHTHTHTHTRTHTHTHTHTRTHTHTQRDRETHRHTHTPSVYCRPIVRCHSPNSTSNVVSSVHPQCPFLL